MMLSQPIRAASSRGFGCHLSLPSWEKGMETIPIGDLTTICHCAAPVLNKCVSSAFFGRRFFFRGLKYLNYLKLVKNWQPWCILKDFLLQEPDKAAVQVRQCMSKALVVQEGWVVWQPGRSTEGREQPALCTSLNRTWTANALLIVRNKINRYMYLHTSSAPKSQAAQFPRFCFKPQYCKNQSEYCMLN